MKKYEKNFNILSISIGITALLYALFMLFKNFFRAKDITGRLYMLVFLLIFVFAFSGGFLRMFKMEKLAKTFEKIAVSIFLTMWLAFTSLATYSLITTKDYSLWYVVVAFWMFFFLAVYKEFIKKK